ncbi:MAG TPA: glycosyltransferase family 2 protein [Paracoccaceae bacterium]|nr:glycosyltransferase family 2 protein [Paracoccaceae bacterium]
MKVSVLILTQDEARNLPRCLGALGWCDDVVVVDSGSRDATREIAAGAGARVIERPFDSFAGQRNFALEQGGLRHGWVLHLDADEVVTPEFRRALEALEPPSELDGYLVPSKMMLFGRWLKHAGQYPSYQVRLGRRGLRFRQVGHGQREDAAPERIGAFPEPYLHHSFSHGMRHWLARHVRYAEDEAAVLASGGASADWPGLLPAARRRRALKAWAGRLPLWLRPAARFAHIYLLRQGFRDGRAGLAYAVMMATYEGMIASYAYERRRAAAEQRAPAGANAPGGERV